MLDFEDDEFDEPSAMVQINTPNPKDLKAYPEQRTILRMRYFKIHPKFQTSIVSIRRGDHIICMGDHTIHRGDHIIRRGDHYDGTNYLRCLLVSEQATVQSSSVGQKQVNPPLLFLIFFCHLQELDHTHGATFTLVFLCSKVTSVPHQIGFKQFRRSSEDLETEEVTSPDHRVELNGHVVGIALDHSGRYLFANVRR